MNTPHSESTPAAPVQRILAAAMFAAEKLDAVDIATWRETHVELTRLAAAHRVHVLCQKPLAPTLAEAESLAAEVAGRIRLMVH